MSLSSRERVQMAVAHQEPDHAPADDELFEDCRTRFVSEGMPEDVSTADYFGFDFAHMALDASPRLPERLIEENEDKVTYVSKSGYSCVRWKRKSGALHYFDHVTQSKEDWDRVKARLAVDVDGSARISTRSYFPPFERYPTWEGAAGEYRGVRQTERYVLLSFYGPLEATWRHHGYVETCMDFVQDREWLGEMMSTYTDLVCATIERGLAEGIKPDGLFLIEDLGTTHGTLMSPEAFRAVIKPCYVRILDLARKRGLTRFMHSDGRIHAILDDLVEVGVQVLNPIDTGSGMTLAELKARYGKNLALWGGISARKMHDEAASNAEIDAQVPVAAKGGGYIYHSDHSVPPTVSLARYKQILDRVRQASSRERLGSAE